MKTPEERTSELTNILRDLINCLESDQGDEDYDENLSDTIAHAKYLLENE
jgi:hypothetical protein